MKEKKMIMVGTKWATFENMRFGKCGSALVCVVESRGVSSDTLRGLYT